MRVKIFLVLVALFVAFCALCYAIWQMLQVRSAADAVAIELEYLQKLENQNTNENAKVAEGSQGASIEGAQESRA